MQWDSIGFKGDPFGTEPIHSHNLELYTGNKAKISGCQFALKSQNVLMVIEGARGVGTTSFGNFLRFSSQQAQEYFTPTNELRVQPTWNAETLLAAMVANIVMELELYHRAKVGHDPVFIEAKAVVSRIAETYRAFGAQGFGFGANYGAAAGPVTQPVIMPSPMIAHHLENLIQLIIKKLKFENGVLLQLNNLDVGVVQEEGHLKQLLNIMRDYFQMKGASFLLVGDVGLQRFIAQQVDRLDDIIGHEVAITPLSQEEYLELIERRVKYYRVHKHVELPVDRAVLLYLYEITQGRLRYIFGLLERLFNYLQVGTLTDRITLEIAKPTIINYAKNRVQQCGLSPSEELVLKEIVRAQSVQVKEIAKRLHKQSNQVSLLLSKLLDHKLVDFKKEGVNRFYSPSVYAHIAFK